MLVMLACHMCDTHQFMYSFQRNFDKLNFVKRKYAFFKFSPDFMKLTRSPGGPRGPAAPGSPLGPLFPSSPCGPGAP